MVRKSRFISLLMLVGALTLSANASTDLSSTRQVVPTSQQDGVFSGVISDSYGPLIGATVVIKGTTNGMTTDIDGKFSLNGVKNGDIIMFSFMGYKTLEIEYTGQSDITLTMEEDADLLDEVVVTALGMKRSQKALGYAVTEIKGDDLSKVAINPVAALQGKVAGVNIQGSDGGMFGSTKIQIRGASTLSGNNQPIYVVDGVILANETKGNSADWNNNADDYGNMLKNLNPDDFASISVLKGAAATALYGSRGLNGAVVITTKSGEGATGFGVSFSQSFGIDHAGEGIDRQMVYGPGQYAGNVTYGDKNAAGQYQKWDNANQFFLNSAGSPTIIGHTARLFGPRFDGRAIETYDGTMTTYSPVEDNMKDAYQLGMNSNTNVAIRGGDEKTSYYSSLSYRKAKGILENNTFERYSMLLKGSHKISERVDISASMSFANSTSANALRNIGGLFIDVQYTNMYDTKYYRDKYLGAHGGIASSNYGDEYANVPGKGLWFDIDNKDNVNKETVIRPMVEMNVKITDWVKFRAEANMNFFYTIGENKELGSGYANEGGYYSLSQYSNKQKTYAGSFFFDKKLPKDFHIGGFLRGEYYTTVNTEQSTNTKGGLVVPGQFFIGNSKERAETSAKVLNTKRMFGAVAAINLAWKNQVYLDITGRNDWSSALVYTSARGNYSYFYPSIGGSWLINETIEMPSWISFAKVRASWAQVGNDASPYSIYSGYGVGSMIQSGGQYIYTNSVPDKLYSTNLKPERKTSWEIGLDWRFIKNRISLDATYYKENTVDQIMTISIPGVSGINQQLVNAGNIQNSGIEIALNTTPFKSKDFEWTVDLTYTRNRSKIVELHPNVATSIGLEGEAGYGNFLVGSVAKLDAEYGLVVTTAAQARDDNGNVILNWRDDFRTPYAARAKGEVEVGSMMPDFLGSISTGLTYKNLSLYIGLDARVGGIVASYSNRYGTAYGYTEESLDYRDTEYGGLSWTSNYSDSKGMAFTDGVIPEGVFAAGTKVTGVDGQSHDVGGQHFSDLVKQGVLEPTHASSYHYWNNGWSTGTVNDYWVNELSYLALREVTIGYQVPQSIASKLGAQGLSVSLSGRNLGYLYNSLPNNLNPEGVRGTKSAEFRERSNSPYTSSYMMTINLSF